DPDHVARDLSARHAVRREVGIHGDLPDRLRDRPHPGRPLRAGGPRGPARPAAGALDAGFGMSPADAPAVMLSLEHVTKRFGGLTAVRDVTLEVRRGDLLGVIGPNGAGKTTLFNLIAGYYRPEGGGTAFDGDAVTRG